MTLPSTSLVRTLLSGVQVRTTYSVFFPLCKDVGHEFRSSLGSVTSVITPSNPFIWRRAESRSQQANWVSNRACCMFGEGWASWASPDFIKTHRPEWASQLSGRFLGSHHWREQQILIFMDIHLSV